MRLIYATRSRRSTAASISFLRAAQSRHFRRGWLRRNQPLAPHRDYGPPTTPACSRNCASTSTIRSSRFARGGSTVRAAFDPSGHAERAELFKSHIDFESRLEWRLDVVGSQLIQRKLAEDHTQLALAYGIHANAGGRRVFG